MKRASVIVNILVLFVMFADEFNSFYQFCLRCHMSLVRYKIAELIF